METEEVEHFIHAPGADPKVVTAVPNDRLRDVLMRVKAITGEQHGMHVFVGECVEALDEADEVEDGADEQPPVDIDLTLAVLEVRRHRHVHVHRCRHIAIEVNFGGKTKRHRFSPNTTVGVATAWARRKFHLDPAVAGEYVLQLCGGPDQPRSDQHLGDLVQGDSCSLCFDLVKEVTPKG